MKENTIVKVDEFFRTNTFATGRPSTVKEISEAETELNLKFDEDYKFFLINYGGSMLGATEIYGFHNSEMMDEVTVVDMTLSYREDEDGETNWLIIGTDYSGNPIGINSEGNVVCYDHDFDELNILATSFEEYVLQALED